MKRRLLVSALFLLSIFCSITPSFAVKAYKNVKKLVQPDGTVVNLVRIGDEYAHSYATEDGFLVKKCNDGFYRYLTLNEFDADTVSKYVAKNKNLRNKEELEFLSNINSEQIFERICSKTESIRKRDEQTKADNLESFRVRNIAAKRASKFLPKNINSLTKADSDPVTARNIVLLVQYSDLSFTSGTKTFYENMMNKSGFIEDGAIGSVKDYFEDQSNNQFSPSFDVIGPITLPNKMGYYGANTGNYELKAPEMVADACKIASEEFGVDFSLYSSGNKVRLNTPLVDLVYIIYAGYGENFTNAPEDAIWPHASNLIDWGMQERYNDVLIGDYACSAELYGGDGNELCGIGVVCHEFSHTIGLMDLYNTVNSDDFCWNEWSIMDSGNYLGQTKKPIGFSAFEKYSVGWIEPKELTKSGNYSLQNLSESKEAFKLSLSEDEYFLFENRQPKGWDVEMPAQEGGMLITRIAYDKVKWNGNTINTSSSYYKKRVILMPADNSPRAATVASDLYPGPTDNTDFSSTSTPQSIYYSGEVVDKPISNIKLIGNLITFNFAFTTSLEDKIYPEKGSIYSEGMDIYINNLNDDKAYVYNVAGKLISVFSLSQNSINSFTLDSPGLFIVKTNSCAAKVTLN
ncbi:MAG: M6 family metalloprotease domain-containing protein [Bacteroidales bacterium]|nr:M6 family metalloprotease domain-containing protein [Bacteroidales bacterium]